MEAELVCMKEKDGGEEKVVLVVQPSSLTELYAMKVWMNENGLPKIVTLDLSKVES